MLQSQGRGLIESSLDLPKGTDDKEDNFENSDRQLLFPQSPMIELSDGLSPEHKLCQLILLLQF